METEKEAAVPAGYSTILTNFLTQVDEQLTKTVEALDNYKTALRRAELVLSRLEGQRDLINAVLKKAQEPVTK